MARSKVSPQSIVLRKLIGILRQFDPKVSGNTLVSDLAISNPYEISVGLAINLNAPELPEKMIERIPNTGHDILGIGESPPESQDQKMTVRSLSISITLWLKEKNPDHPIFIPQAA